MILDKINDILNSHSSNSTLFDFCFYVKLNIQKMPTYSIEDIARESFISKGQISKCIRKLDYKNFMEFKDACIQFLDSINKRKKFIDNQLNFEENVKSFTIELTKNINYTVEHINLNLLQELIKEIKMANNIYLFAHGDARSLCYNIQRELQTYSISTLICDADFNKNYSFYEGDRLIVISTNGYSFVYNKRIIQRIKKAKVKKWLITCNDQIKLCNNQIFIPTLDKKYSEYIMKYIIDILLLQLQS